MATAKRAGAVRAAADRAAAAQARASGATAPAGVRAERTRATRRRMLGAAHDLFVAHGYTATTIGAIAERAGVAPQTIYFTFTNKRALLKELIDVAVAGDDDPIPTLQRSWVQQALAATDATEQLRRHVRGACAIYRRVGPLLEVLRGATTADTQLRALWQTNKRQRHIVQAQLAAALCTKRGYGGPADPARLADILYAMLSPEMFGLLTTDRRWSLARCEQWMVDTLCAQLVESGA